MRNTARLTRIAAALAVSGLLVASAASARPGGSHGMHFERIDQNGDGAITQAEIEAHRAAKIAGLDANADGIVSFEEMQAHKEREREQRARERFQKLDADGDGRVSVDEFSARGERMFDRMLEKLDKDGDGAISKEEMQEARKGMHRGGHRGMHHGDRN